MNLWDKRTLNHVRKFIKRLGRATVLKLTVAGSLASILTVLVAFDSYGSTPMIPADLWEGVSYPVTLVRDLELQNRDSDNCLRTIVSLVGHSSTRREELQAIDSCSTLIISLEGNFTTRAILHTVRGASKLQAGLYQEAIADFESAQNLDSDYFWSSYLAAVAYQEELDRLILNASEEVSEGEVLAEIRELVLKKEAAEAKWRAMEKAVRSTRSAAFLLVSRIDENISHPVVVCGLIPLQPNDGVNFKKFSDLRRSDAPKDGSRPVRARHASPYCEGNLIAGFTIPSSVQREMGSELDTFKTGRLGHHLTIVTCHSGESIQGNLGIAEKHISSYEWRDDYIVKRATTDMLGDDRSRTGPAGSSTGRTYTCSADNLVEVYIVPFFPLSEVRPNLAGSKSTDPGEGVRFLRISAAGPIDELELVRQSNRMVKRSRLLSVVTTSSTFRCCSDAPVNTPG